MSTKSTANFSNVFDAHAYDWWNEHGSFKPLHHINPHRIDFLTQHLKSRGLLNEDPYQSLRGLTILDVGCGGGILCEPLARLGAHVTGIDCSDAAIDVARTHAMEHGLDITYDVQNIEHIQKKTFDVVIASEVIEHVDDPARFVHDISNVLKPGGFAMITTLNRTWKSCILGIYVAENILRWAPKGAHQHDKFITPSELFSYAENAGMHMRHMAGLVFSPLTWSWSLDESVSPDVSINYFSFFEKLLGA